MSIGDKSDTLLGFVRRGSALGCTRWKGYAVGEREGLWSSGSHTEVSEVTSLLTEMRLALPMHWLSFRPCPMACFSPPIRSLSVGPEIYKLRCSHGPELESQSYSQRQHSILAKGGSHLSVATGAYSVLHYNPRVFAGNWLPFGRRSCSSRTTWLNMPEIKFMSCNHRA